MPQENTKNKRTKEAPLEGEERYRSFFETITLGVVYQDTSGYIVSANPAAEKILGLSMNQMQGRTSIDPRWRAVHEDGTNFPGETHPSMMALKTGKQVNDVIMGIFNPHDGQLHWININAVPQFEQGAKQPYQMYTIFEDITERKRAEEKEKELQRELIVASRLATTGEMAAGIAHEINNPLTGVLGYADLLMQRDLPEDIRREVEIIHKGGQRVANVVNRMLTFARQTKPKKVLIDINKVLSTTLDMQRYFLETSNMIITTDLDPNLPLTIADGGQMQQVFLNIIFNAEASMKTAHDKGALKIKTDTINNHIRISIADDGPGIPKKNINKIFDPFFTTKEVGEGTGLGLSICHGIVTEHGGRIYAESKAGKGATFTIYLPIADKPEQLELQKTGDDKAIAKRSASILVVDDEEIVSTFLKDMLTQAGHSVEIVNNATDALKDMARDEFDVVLLDIKMPDMSGIELYKEAVKSNPDIAHKVIFITGDVMGKGTGSFLKKEKLPYITKPIDIKKLKQSINSIITGAS